MQGNPALVLCQNGHNVVTQMDGDPMRDLNDVRRTLAARVERGWERLEDALDELATVHGLPKQEIVARIEQLLAERSAEFDEGGRNGDKRAATLDRR